jgi:putative ABC transport system ATP-binding protein
MNVIEVKNITKHYLIGTQTVEALRGISFGVEQGEFIAIMGPSGSGKSTLMNIIGCLDSPTDGTYHLNNQEVSTLEGDELAVIRNKEIGFVFQNFHLLARNSALDNVMLPLKYAGVDKVDQLARAKNVISQVGLESRMDHQPSELSGGQQQRVAIARALVNNPSILFADEPTGNLDSQTGYDVMQLFHNLHQQGQTIILITHENEVAAEAQRTIFIKDGLIESDTRKEKS